MSALHQFSSSFSGILPLVSQAELNHLVVFKVVQSRFQLSELVPLLWPIPHVEMVKPPHDGEVSIYTQESGQARVAESACHR